MFFSRKNKPRERFYLFPGQGGSNYYRKQKLFIGWTVVAAVIFGSLFAVMLWWFSKPNP